MKRIKDRFSIQSENYKKYRPSYPAEMYRDMLQLTKERTACWDCGTGNGQVAMVLSEHFETVHATDISEEQLSIAPKKDNILYSLQRAESTSFKNDLFDLVTVAQALHWFDFAEFNKEVNRVVKNGGILYAWGYGLLKIDPKIDRLIEEFHTEIVGPFWDVERKYIESEYKTIYLDFREINPSNSYAVQTSWSLAELEGYFNSWSSVQHYYHKEGNNPVEWIITRLRPLWNTNTKKAINFPIFTRIGKIEK